MRFAFEAFFAPVLWSDRRAYIVDLFAERLAALFAVNARSIFPARHCDS